MKRTALYGLFFLSGVSALMYELAWQRLLNLVFGVSTLSVSAVLAALMAGLALGGLLLGRLADHTSRPLRGYAWLEAGIGLAGLLVPAGFTVLAVVYTRLYTLWQPGPWSGACLRFGLACVVLLAPATLMGGTLPFMGRLAWRRTQRLPATFSLLYAVNTLGAVVGAALTGFVLLHYLGMQRTLWLAAGLNLVVAVSAALGAWFREPVAAAGLIALPSEPTIGSASAAGVTLGPVLALACAGLTGMTSMGFEVAWARVLGILTSNSAYGFALMLTVLLLGLGLGSWLQWGWSRWPGDHWRRLALCQWLLAGISLATVPFFHNAPSWLDQWCDGRSIAVVFLGELALTSGLLFGPAVLMGMSLPLLVAGVTSEAGHFSRGVGRIYAVNTLGCALGAFLAGLLFIPWLGLQATLGLLSAATVLVGLAAWSRVTWPAVGWRRLAAVMVVVAAVGGWLLLPAAPYLKSPLAGPRQLLFYKEGNNATVSVVAEADGTRSILVDGQPVAGTVCTSVVDQKMLAHLPLLLHPHPRRALTVGFGSGGTSYSMTLHGVAVDCVEIESAVTDAAKYFESENHGILSHPHFRLTVDDARSWLRVAPAPYDVIATDCTNIQYRSNGDLYTVDYFRLLKRRLSPEGVAVAWVPANGIHDSDLRTLLRSFREVFPHTSVWFMNSLATDFLIVIGTPGPLHIDMTRLAERMHVPAVARDLQAVGLADPARMVYTLLSADQELARYLGTGPLNTDDRPVLSYTTYGASFQPTIAGNLLRLLDCRTDVARYVEHAAPPESMLRHYAASNDLILGHIAHLVGAETASLGYYVKGAQLLPADPALRQLVRGAYLCLQTPKIHVQPSAN